MFLWSIYTNMFFLKEIYYKLDSLLKIFFPYIQMVVESAQTYAKVALLITNRGHYKATKVSQRTKRNKRRGKNNKSNAKNG